MVLVGVLALTVGSLTAQDSAFGFYVQAKDAKFGFSKVSTHPESYDLTAHEWQGLNWKHRVALMRPKGQTIASDTCILEITGGPINETDLQRAQVAANLSKLPVAVLFDIPNQPIWGLREDELIAATFAKFVQEKDHSLPLLMPMTKSTVMAMNLLESALKLKRFVLTGASKRGWTAWLAAATGDPRIIGLAPRVFDNLNMGEQLRHQIAVFGDLSPKIKPYGDFLRQLSGSSDVLAALSSPAIQELQRMVDPFSYRAKVNVPVLVVNGARDDFWAPDAAKLYWGSLGSKKWLVTNPAGDHGWGDPALADTSLAAFAHATALGISLPKLEFDSNELAKGMVSTLAMPECQGAELWTAASMSPNVGDWNWELVKTFKPGAAAFPVGVAHEAKYNAYFLRFNFERNGLKFTLCSPTVLKRG